MPPESACPIPRPARSRSRAAPRTRGGSATDSCSFCIPGKLGDEQVRDARCMQLAELLELLSRYALVVELGFSEHLPLVEGLERARRLESVARHHRGEKTLRDVFEARVEHDASFVDENRIG